MKITTHTDMLHFIDAIRESDPYIRDIYMNGGCYQFHLLLKKFAPECVPMVNKELTHVVTFFMNRFYDITGAVSGVFYVPTLFDLQECEKWSFAKNNLLKITDCPNCDEPITV
jgi:hypothetical protein